MHRVPLALSSALALAVSVSPQQPLRVTATGPFTLDVRLGELPRESTGLGALLAVPDTQETLIAVLRTVGEQFDVRVLGATRPANPIPLVLHHLPAGRLRRATAIGPPARVGGGLFSFEFDATDTDSAARTYDEVLADCRARQLPLSEDAPLPSARRFRTNDGGTSFWVLQRDAQIVTGSGDVPLELVATAATTPGLSIHVALDGATLDPTDRFVRELAAFCGIEGAVQFVHEATTDARGCREEWLLRGQGPAQVPPGHDITETPRLPPLPGQFVIVRAHLGGTPVQAELRKALRRHGLPADDTALLPVVDACTGALAFGVAAPALGSVYPRVTVGLRLRPDHGVDAALQRLAATVDGIDARAIDGASVVTWRLPNAPPALWPACCVVDDVLWIAETPMTLRSVRKALSDATDVFADEEAVACVAPDGSTMLAEAWFDCGTIWELAGRNWATPLVRAALFPDADSPLWQGPPIRERDALPEARQVAATLGRGRAVLFAAEDGWGARLRAPTIGPLLSLFASVAVPMVPDVISMALEERRRAASALATHERARRLGAALRLYRGDHEDAAPTALDELVPLLAVGDAEPLVAPLGSADAGIEHLRRSSFQLAPVGMQTIVDRASVPGTGPEPDPPAEPPAARAVFAFCGFGYLGHHLVVLADGDVAWVRSERVLDAVTQRTGR